MSKLSRKVSGRPGDMPEVKSGQADIALAIAEAKKAEADTLGHALFATQKAHCNRRPNEL